MEVSGGRCDPLRGAAAELVDCYASCIGAAHTSDGLQLVEEVADRGGHPVSAIFKMSLRSKAVDTT